MQTAGERFQSDTITVRVERKLKDEFVLGCKDREPSRFRNPRDLMMAYIENREREQFEVEARRESELISASFDQKEADLWFEETWNMPGWR